MFLFFDLSILTEIEKTLVVIKRRQRLQRYPEEGGRGRCFQDGSYARTNANQSERMRTQARRTNHTPSILFFLSLVFSLLLYRSTSDHGSGFFASTDSSTVNYTTRFQASDRLQRPDLSTPIGYHRYMRERMNVRINWKFLFGHTPRSPLGRLVSFVVVPFSSVIRRSRYLSPLLRTLFSSPPTILVLSLPLGGCARAQARSLNVVCHGRAREGGKSSARRTTPLLPPHYITIPSLSLTLSLAHTHARTLSLSLSLSRSFVRSLSLSLAPSHNSTLILLEY